MTVKEIRTKISQTKFEMKAQGVRQVPFHKRKGRLSPLSYGYNIRLDCLCGQLGRALAAQEKKTS